MPDLTLMKTLLTLVLLLTTAAAQAADDTCAKAYETAQELRADGLLRAARDVLRMCVRPSCPTFIRNDCGKWLGDVDTSLPTVAFAVRMAGQDLEEVTVTCDEELLTERLDGRPIALDPGKHSCRFEAAGAQTGQLDVLIAEGHKNRVVQVDLRTPAAPPAPTPTPAPPPTRAAAPAPRVRRAPPAPPLSAAGGAGPSPPATRRSASMRTRLAIGFAATALAGVGSFVGLGLGVWARSGTCRPAAPPAAATPTWRASARPTSWPTSGWGWGWPRPPPPPTSCSPVARASRRARAGRLEPRSGRVPLPDGAAVAVRSPVLRSSAMQPPASLCSSPALPPATAGCSVHSLDYLSSGYTPDPPLPPDAPVNLAPRDAGAYPDAARAGRGGAAAAARRPTPPRRDQGRRRRRGRDPPTPPTPRPPRSSSSWATARCRPPTRSSSGTCAPRACAWSRWSTTCSATVDTGPASLILISSTVSVMAVGARFRDVAKPVVVAEPLLYDDMGMVESMVAMGVNRGIEPMVTTLTIVDPGARWPPA